MQYVLQISLFGALMLLILLKFDVSAINRLVARSLREFENFLRITDAVFVSFGGDVSELAYRSRMLTECANTPAQKIAAIHIILGAAQTAINSAEHSEREITEKLHSAAQSAILALNLLQSARQSAYQKWRNMLGTPEKLNEETIQTAKAQILAEFSKRYNAPFAQ